MAGFHARPVPRTFTIEQLVELAMDGALRIPDFQRQLKWGRRDIRDLFDSIRRGYPIGNVLLSKGVVGAANVPFGPRIVAAAARSDGYQVVDGQQRITALVGVLRHPDPAPRTGPYALYYDLEKEDFAWSRGGVGPAFVPLNVVLSGTELHEWLDARTLPSADLKRRLFELGSRIREYVVPCYELPSADEATLRHLFQRVNTAGKPMESTEVFDALQRGGALTFRSVATRLAEQTTFGALDSKTIERACAAVAGRDARPASEDLPRTFDGMRRTIDFLVQKGFRHLAVLPYTLPLIVLPAFFDKHPTPAPRVLVLLSRWVWRGALTQEHGASSNANVRDLLGRITDDEHSSVAALLATVETPGQLPGAALHWSGSSAVMRAYLAGFLATAEDADLVDSIGLPDDGSRALGNLFVDVTGGKHVSVARALLLRPAIGTRGGVAKRIEATLEDPAWRAVNGVSDEALVAYRRGDLTTFERLRASTLDARVVPYLRGQIRGDDGDRPTIDYLVGDAVSKVAAFVHANT